LPDLNSRVAVRLVVAEKGFAPQHLINHLARGKPTGVVP
jgi:hypothetical protein